MSLYHLALLALIQGITEFLPISSSGHLILFPQLTGLEDQGLLLDVAVHIGTLLAVMLYFRADVARLIIGLLHHLRGNRHSAEARLFGLMVLATIPVVLLGALLALTGWVDALRNVTVIGATMLGFGLLLYWADQRGPTARKASGWSLRDALIMGLWQAIALIPGTSRSGITITAARMRGFERHDAARLSMLMSIPTIMASGVLTGIEAIPHATAERLWDAAIAAGLSFAAALLALTLMMRLLNSISFTPYVVYRIALGALLILIGTGVITL